MRLSQIESFEVEQSLVDDLPRTLFEQWTLKRYEPGHVEAQRGVSEHSVRPVLYFVAKYNGDAIWVTLRWPVRMGRQFVKRLKKLTPKRMGNNYFFSKLVSRDRWNAFYKDHIISALTAINQKSLW